MQLVLDLEINVYCTNLDVFFLDYFAYQTVKLYVCLVNSYRARVAQWIEYFDS